ncbi:MAG TPA: hypothetical protein VFZ65_17575 [Planctomycetota bacterium]|nr:hypothetical protein [Planctomycetota bacterium]
MPEPVRLQSPAPASRASPSPRRGLARLGAAPVLLGLVVLFFAAFHWQRARSGFLAIERDRAAAAAVAAQHALSLAEACALRDLVGAGAPIAAWHAAAATFAAQRARLGDALAAVAAAGDLAGADAALRSAGDPERAWRAFRVEAAALPGVRFLAMRERFAARGQMRD